jgi:hypothetical protein
MSLTEVPVGLIEQRALQLLAGCGRSREFQEIGNTDKFSDGKTATGFNWRV